MLWNNPNWINQKATTHANSEPTTTQAPRKVIIFIMDDGKKKFYNVITTSKSMDGILSEVSEKELVPKEKIILKPHSNDIIKDFQLED